MVLNRLIDICLKTESAVEFYVTVRVIENAKCLISQVTQREGPIYVRCVLYWYCLVEQALGCLCWE